MLMNEPFLYVVVHRDSIYTHTHTHRHAHTELLVCLWLKVNIILVIMQWYAVSSFYTSQNSVQVARNYSSCKVKKPSCVYFLTCGIWQRLLEGLDGEVLLPDGHKDLVVTASWSASSVGGGGLSPGQVIPVTGKVTPSGCLARCLSA